MNNEHKGVAKINILHFSLLLYINKSPSLAPFKKSKTLLIHEKINLMYYTGYYSILCHKHAIVFGNQNKVNSPVNFFLSYRRLKF